MPDDVEVILQIPHIALKLKFPNVPSSSASNSKQWNVLWTLELSEKIKIFMWRAAKNILPTAENL